MDRQNKKFSCARKSGRRKNNAGTDTEEEKKLAEPMVKKELPAEGCSRRNGKREESSRQKSKLEQYFISMLSSFRQDGRPILYTLRACGL